MNKQNPAIDSRAIGSDYPARYWHWTEDQRIQCDLCPRDCKLHEGQRGACFVRMRCGDQMILTTYGRSSGFCVDPIEKKPLNHFYPGSSILSFGTAGCNLACKFCQNWDISKSRDMDRIQSQASPAMIADAAVQLGCKSVAFTYNDPIIFAEYAMDVADACHARGIKTVAVTPMETLVRARNIARAAGLQYVYTGNVHNAEGDTTRCPSCNTLLIERDWYQINRYQLTPNGHCPHCGTVLSGRFDAKAGNFGRQRIPVSFNG